MKRSAILAAALLALAVQTASTHTTTAYLNASSSDVPFTDWMAALPDGLPLAQMSIPGTHDSGASVFGRETTETQSMDFTEQLRAGIRAFDVRLAVGNETAFCPDPNTLYVYHGISCQTLQLAVDILEPMTTFLTDHPGEAILMRIKHEHDRDPDCEDDQDCEDEEAHRDSRFRNGLQISLFPSEAFLFTGASAANPTLGELRGKILILDDFDGALVSTLTTVRAWSDADIQDEFSLGDNWDLAEKWWNVAEQLEDADTSADSDAEALHVNFLSASGGVFPYFIASGHSSWETGAPRLLTGWTRGVINTCGTPSQTNQCLPMYPSVNCFLGTCSVAFEGVNHIAKNVIGTAVRRRTGVVYADFPGAGLIAAVIGVNSRNTAGVINSTPVLGLTTGPVSVNEDGTVTITGTITDPDPTDTFVLTIDWSEFCADLGKECSADSITLPAGTTTFSRSHTYLDDDPTSTPSDTHVVTVNVSDSEGASSEEAQVTVTVINLAPTVSLSAPIMNEGDLATLTGRIGDPGSRDTFEVSVTWGDSRSDSFVDQPGGDFQLTHRYPDDNSTDTFHVTVGVVDDDGASVVGSTTVTVRNVAPTVTATGSTVNEGALATVSGSIADPGVFDDGVLTVNWGDGVTASFPYVAGAGYAHTHQYVDDGTYSVTATAVDKDGGISAVVQTSVTVDNVAPNVTAPNVTMPEGGPANLALTIFDPGRLDTFSVRVDWGDGSPVSMFTLGPGAANGGVVDEFGLHFNATHAYPNDASYIVAVTVLDDDGGVGTRTATFTITNAPPVVSATGSTIVENGLATVSGTIIDPAALDTVGLRIEWGDGAGETVDFPAGPVLFTRTHRYLDDPAGPGSGDFAVRLVATDNDGAGTETTAIVTVNNAAPLVTAAGATIDEHGVGTVTGSIVDRGTLDSFTLTVDWGDGVPASYSYPAGTTNYVVTHQYLDDNPTGTTSDDYTVAVIVTDDDAGAGAATAVVRVDNVAPVVTSVVVRDETGAIIPADAAFAPAGLAVDLEAAFTDVGTGDTHAGSIDWGDGTSTDGIVTGTGGHGTMSARHTFIEPGRITIAATVRDDDLGGATRQATIAVLDPAGALCALAERASTVANQPALDGQTQMIVTRLLGEIRGNAGGRAANGACDLFAKGNDLAGVVRLTQAIGTLEQLLAGAVLDGTRQALLHQVGNGLVLSAKSAYLSLVRAATNGDDSDRARSRLADAAALAQLADAALLAGNRIAAMDNWTRAIRLIAPAASE